MHSLEKGRIEAFMGLFRDTKAIERLQDRIAELETVGDTLAREVRGLKLEYIELYDKVRHQMSRMAKRSAVDTGKFAAPEVTEGVVDGIDEISAKILALRTGPRTAA